MILKPSRIQLHELKVSYHGRRKKLPATWKSVAWLEEEEIKELDRLENLREIAVLEGACCAEYGSEVRVKMTERFCTYVMINVGGWVALRAHVLSTEHCRCILSSLRIIVCPYLSQSDENWLSNDGLCPGDEDASAPRTPLRIS
jgi:hypothetical protein